MAVSQMDSCCACCSLKTGCLILGWLVCISSAAHYLYIYLPTASSDTSIRMNPGVDLAIDVDVLLNLIVGIVLLIGIYKGKASFLVPYLVLSVVEIFAYIMVSVVAIFATGIVIGAAAAKGEIKESEKDAVRVAVVIFFTVLALLGALKVYFFRVVKSYYNVLHKAGSRMERLEP